MYFFCQFAVLLFLTWFKSIPSTAETIWPSAAVEKSQHLPRTTSTICLKTATPPNSEAITTSDSNSPTSSVSNLSSALSTRNHTSLAVRTKSQMIWQNTSRNATPVPQQQQNQMKNKKPRFIACVVSQNFAMKLLDK